MAVAVLDGQLAGGRNQTVVDGALALPRVKTELALG
jgi:hypothetical protein